MTTTAPADIDRARPGVTGAWPPSLLERGAAQATAGFDVALRTGASTILAAASAPRLLGRGQAEAQIATFDFYRELAARHDATATFLEPPPVDVEVRSLRTPRWMFGQGAIDRLKFTSPYEPRHPDVDEFCDARHPNNTARAQYWRHPDGARPTIIVLHGFSASPAPLNSAFFSLPWFFGHGCDVVLVTLPFHGRRARVRLPMDGVELFSAGLVSMNEAMLQAVSDIRSLVSYLLDERGAPAVGVTGLSLGGYLSATLAAAEPRLAFAVPNAPAVHFGEIMRLWFPAGAAMRLALGRVGVSMEDLDEVLAVHGPLNYAPAIDHDRLFVIGGLGDRLTPPAQARMLWEHWDRPRMHWYPGNHVVHLQRSAYLREMGRFLGTIGFSEG